MNKKVILPLLLAALIIPSLASAARADYDGDGYRDHAVFTRWEYRHPGFVIRHPGEARYLNRHPERSEQFLNVIHRDGDGDGYRDYMRLQRAENYGNRGWGWRW